MENRSLTLYELNSLVRTVIDEVMPNEYWVEAELSEIREVRGHCYMELIEKEEGGNTPIAKASAKCWRDKWHVINRNFVRVTSLNLHAGMKVMLRVYAQFHEAYGFSWIVSDINPEFTMGDMARKRLEIIRQLKEEGVFDLNRQLSLSGFANRIAVVSTATAAGYGDFCNQLAENEYGLTFHTQLFPATMQGEMVESTVIEALNKIYQQIERFDAVVIIRGGGATADLSGFDSLLLAENVANFPLPVITGIGHDRDESIIDMVSHTRVKTPTAAASFFISLLSATLTAIDRCRERILNSVRGIRELEKERLFHIVASLPSKVNYFVERNYDMTSRLSQRLATASSKIVTDGMLRIERCGNVSDKALQYLDNEKHRIDKLELRINSCNPHRLLAYGYSITLHNGHAVTDVSALGQGDEIETLTNDGKIVSIVKEVEKRQ